MIIVEDIEYLHLSSFQETIDAYIPSAKILHIFYGCGWTNLLYEPIPKDIEVRWSKLYSLDPEIFFDECISNASKTDADDILFLIDPSYSVGKKILDK
jgi:hypothetical protein